MNRKLGFLAFFVTSMLIVFAISVKDATTINQPHIQLSSDSKLNTTNALNVELVGSHPLPSLAWDVEVEGNYAYVANSAQGFQIFNVSNPSHPSQIANVSTVVAESIAVKGNYAYVAGTQGLDIYNVSNPSSPYIVGTSNDGYARAVYVVGHYAYLARQTSFQIIDVNNPTNPYEVARVTTPSTIGRGGDIHVSENYAYFANLNNGLHIIDISDPINPDIVETLNIYAEDVKVEGDYAYVASAFGGLRILDISSPDNPKELGSFPSYAFHVDVQGDLAFVTVWDHDHSYSGLQVIDVSNPNNPKLRGYYETQGQTLGIDVETNTIGIIEIGPTPADLRLLRYTGEQNYVDLRQSGSIQISGDLFEGGKVYLEIPVKNYGTKASLSIHPYTEGYTAKGSLWRADGANPTAKIIQPGETVNFKVEHDLWWDHAGRWTTYGVFLWNDEDNTYLNPLLANGNDQTLEFFVYPKVEVSHIEVTQGIQCYDNDIDEACLDNSVPLIASKQTVVRAYLNADVDTGAAVQGTLYANNGDGWVAIKSENQLAVAVPPANFDRDNQRNSLQFVLPDSVTSGSIDLYIEVFINPLQTTRYPASEYKSFLFQETIPIQIGYVSVQTLFGDRPDETRMANAYGYLEEIYPVAQVDYFPVAYHWPFIPSPLIENDVINYLSGIVTYYKIMGWPEPNGVPQHLFGWRPASEFDSNEPAGRGEEPGHLAWGYNLPDRNYNQLILAHEIGHNLGRMHTDDDEIWPYRNTNRPDDIHDTGYDFGFYSTFNPLLPASTDDIMNARVRIAEENWISAYTYRNLFTARDYTNLSTQKDIIPESITIAGPVLYVNGHVQSNDEAQFSDVFQFASENIITQTIGREYCLQLEDNEGTNLASSCFDLDFWDPENGEPTDSDSFVRVLPFNPQATRLKLLRGSNVLAEREASSFKPTITLLSPNGGEVVDDEILISWEASDADNDPLSYTVSYSPNNGTDWILLGIGITNTQLLIDTDLLPGGTNGIIRVTVSDGFHASQDNTDAFFALLPHSPTVIIAAPESETNFKLGQTIIFRGYGYDTEDGLFKDQELIWSSDRIGILGTGRILQVRSLPQGSHIITLKVTDSDGLSEESSINIYVGHRSFLPIITR